jgi:hypothetical protein
MSDYGVFWRHYFLVRIRVDSEIIARERITDVTLAHICLSL